MARFLQGAMPSPQDNGLGSGPLLTPDEYATLARAPRRSAAQSPTGADACPVRVGPPSRGVGTEVTVQALPVGLTGNAADHMFDVFDDGHQQFIARGGPNFQSAGGAALAVALNGPIVTGRVDRAPDSPDYRQGQRILSSGFLPGVTADAAVAGARQHASGVNRGGNPYLKESNSNSFAGDVFEDLFGCRPGDSRTWGYRTRLTEDPPALWQVAGPMY